MKNKLWNRLLKVYGAIEKVPSLTSLTGLKSQDFWCHALFWKVPNYVPRATGPKSMISRPYRKSFKWGQYLSVLQLYSWKNLILIWASWMNSFLIDGQLDILEGCIMDCMVERCMVERFVIIFISLQARLYGLYNNVYCSEMSPPL